MSGLENIVGSYRQWTPGYNPNRIPFTVGEIVGYLHMLHYDGAPDESGDPGNCPQASRDRILRSSVVIQKKRETMSEKKTMPLRDEYLLFLDLETTGTDPERDAVLECAYVLMEAKSLSLDFICQSSEIILVNDDLDDLMSPFVKDMHTKSGLLDDMRKTPMTERFGLETMLSQFLSTTQKQLNIPYGDVYGKPWIRLAGYSPQFDRQFILRDAPHFSQLLSHRMMDVSSLRAAAKAWCPSLVTEQEVEHRALADCIAAIEELKTYRTVFETHGK